MERASRGGGRAPAGAAAPCLGVCAVCADGPGGPWPRERSLAEVSHLRLLPAPPVCSPWSRTAAGEAALRASVPRKGLGWTREPPCLPPPPAPPPRTPMPAAWQRSSLGGPPRRGHGGRGLAGTCWLFGASEALDLRRARQELRCVLPVGCGRRPKALSGLVPVCQWGAGGAGLQGKDVGTRVLSPPPPLWPLSQAPPLEAPALEDTAQRPSPPVCLTQAPRPSPALVFCHWAPALGRSLGWGRPLSGPWCRANRHVARVAATLQARQGDPAEATSPSGSKSECGLCRWSPGPLPRTAPRQERKEDELKVPQRSLVGPSGWCGHSCPSASRSRRVEWAMPAPGPERPPVLLGDPRSGQRAQKAERQGLDAGGWASGGRPPAALPSLHPGGGQLCTPPSGQACTGASSPLGRA